MPAWDAAFEVPDVIGFADYLAFENEFCRDLLHRAIGGVPGPMFVFPYPNTPSKVRKMAILDVGDLVIYRTVAGYVVSVTDQLLGDKVKSSRLAARPPAWRFRAPRKAHAEFREESIQLLRRQATQAMLQTDLESYFESVDLNQLGLFLVSCGCPEEAIAIIARLLTAWQWRHGLRGLPIGPEASAVLGNAFLHPVDEMLAAHGIPHVRWMDDMNLFASDETACEGFLRVLDAQLRQQRLGRSIEKTVIHSGPEAEARIQNGTLASLAAVLSADRSDGAERARAVFDEEVRGRPGAHPGTFRFVIKTLGNEHDPYAARALLEDADVLNIDPRVGAEYIAKTALDDGRIAEALFRAVEEPASERGDARRMHLMRTAAARSWGKDEGNLLMSIVLNSRERPPVRAWAMTAVRGTPGWDQSEAEGVALTDSDHMTARAATATLRSAPNRSGVARFASKLALSRPSLKFAARWAQVA